MANSVWLLVLFLLCYVLPLVLGAVIGKVRARTVIQPKTTELSAKQYAFYMAIFYLVPFAGMLFMSILAFSAQNVHLRMFAKVLLFFFAILLVFICVAFFLSVLLAKQSLA